MYRIRFLLLLLPLLAGCATRHAAPNLANVPIPALSYAAALDGGTLTPIQSPIIVKYAPYPTASFERLTRGGGTGGGKTVSISERTTGTMFAEAEATGDLLSVTFTIQNVTATGNMPDEVQESLSIKGAKVILLLSEPSGTIKNVNVFMPPSVVDPAKPHTDAEEFARSFIADDAPATGLPQTGSMPYHETYPKTDSDSGGSFDGKFAVVGKGTYRGRPVVVLDTSGVISTDGQALGFRGYVFLDTATGIFSHKEGVVQGNMSIEGTAVQVSVHMIDDVRF
jgi:hypothetical protein